MKEKWEKKYEIAKKYYEEHGNLDVEYSYITDDNVKLGVWINTQRMAYKNRLVPSEMRTNRFSPLSDEQVELLENIEMIWESKKTKYNKLWMDYYKLAKKYYEEHGNLNIKIDYVTESGIRLGVWINKQCQAYKKSLLTEDRILLLENIGIMWNKNEEIWMKNYKLAKKYYETYGNLKIERTYISSEGTNLGIWINTQRQAYKNRFIPKSERKNSFAPLTDEQVELLESIGMIWDASLDYESKWKSTYNKAKEYYEEHGNLNVKQSYVTEDGCCLGTWINTQRQAYRNRFISKSKEKKSITSLTDEQVELLESIGIIWDCNEYSLVSKPFTKSKYKQLEKRFLEFLSYYIKENKNEIESIEDIKKISDEFIETLGNKENHYKSFTKLKK